MKPKHHPSTEPALSAELLNKKYTEASQATRRTHLIKMDELESLTDEGLDDLPAHSSSTDQKL